MPKYIPVAAAGYPKYNLKCLINDSIIFTQIEVPSDIEVTYEYGSIQTRFKFNGKSLICRVPPVYSDDDLSALFWVVNDVSISLDFVQAQSSVFRDDLWVAYSIFDKQQTEQGVSISKQSRLLPGQDAYLTFPCSCLEYTEHRKGPLRVAIIHLNDKHEDWSREDIADWLDELHDSGIVNLEFEPWEDLDKDTGSV